MSVFLSGLSVLSGVRKSSFQLKVKPEKRSDWQNCRINDDGCILVEDCRAQQEPILKLMMNKYPNQDMTVILVCTKETIGCSNRDLRLVNATMDTIKELENVHQPERSNDASRNGKNNVPQEDYSAWKRYNTFGYFMERMRRFYNPNAEWFLNSSGNSSLVLKDEQLASARNDGERWELKKGSHSLRVWIVAIDKDDPGNGVHNAVKNLRELLVNNDGMGHEPFWVDTHGGLRDIDHTLNSIVSILKEERISPECVYSVEFASVGDTNKHYNIIDVQKSYYIGRFVNGIYDFINYGRGDTLLDYYRDTQDKNIEQFLNAIRKISFGTELCDPDVYKAGLKDLQIALNSISFERETFSPNKENDIGNRNDYIYTFIDLIKNDFGDLVKDNYTTLGIIKRCFNKKLYQQALTFLETYMPTWYVEQGMIIYDANSCDPFLKLDAIDNDLDYESPVNRMVFRLCAQVNVLSVLVSEEDSPSHKKIIEFYAEWLDKDKKEYGQEHRERFKNESKEHKFCTEMVLNLSFKNTTKKDLKKYAKKIKVLEPICEQIKDKADEYILKSSETYCGSSEKNGQILLGTNIQDKKFLELAQDLLVMHSSLKHCRNKFNHAASDRPENDQIIATLEVFIQCCEEMQTYLKDLKH